MKNNEGYFCNICTEKIYTQEGDIMYAPYFSKIKVKVNKLSKEIIKHERMNAFRHLCERCTRKIVTFMYEMIDDNRKGYGK